MTQNMFDDDNWYFAYGSNLSKEQMLRRTGSIPASKVALLENYQFAFRKVLVGDEVFATIVPRQNSIVHGVVYRCSPQAMLQLDHFEGLAENCYRRELVHVTTQDGEILPCVVYVGHAFTDDSATPGASYWNLIRTGAHQHNLPVEYIQTLTQFARKSAK